MSKINLTGGGKKTVPPVAKVTDSPDKPATEEAAPDSLRPTAPAAPTNNDDGHPSKVVTMQHSDVQSRLRQAVPRDLNTPVLGQYEAVIKQDPLNLVAPSGRAIRFEHGRFEATTEEEVEYLQEFIDRGLVRKLEEL